jgi:uncharacterized protein YndB with AHSA1/START domain
VTPSGPRVQVSAVIRRPRGVVFDAWVNPERMASFLCAGDTRVAAIDVDPRVGGRFRIVMANQHGNYDHHGRYLEIDRPLRLRFTWTSASTGGAETEVTVQFDEIDGGTKITLVQVGLPDPAAAQRHERGWQSILDKCRASVDHEAHPFA